MAWSDFKGIWKITGITNTPRCSKGELVAIGGSATNVFIYCIDNKSSHLYTSGGTYSSNSDSISGPTTDGFTLTRSGSVLTFTEPGKEGGVNTGTWTANDTLPEVGNGHGQDSE